MPKPQKCRRICQKPKFLHFSSNDSQSTTTIQLTLDEFEVIRLVDLEKKTHKECAELMDISRTTVTEIYDTARWKLAHALVNGQSLTIGGGNYRLCDGSALGYCKKKCTQHNEYSACSKHNPSCQGCEKKCCHLIKENDNQYSM